MFQGSNLTVFLSLFWFLGRPALRLCTGRISWRKRSWVSLERPRKCDRSPLDQQTPYWLVIFRPPRHCSSHNSSINTCPRYEEMKFLNENIIALFIGDRLESVLKCRSQKFPRLVCSDSCYKGYNRKSQYVMFGWMRLDFHSQRK